MARPYKLSKNLERILSKLSKKDKVAYEQILKKIDEIINCNNPEAYKNLREPLQNFKRIHIKKSFVLVFSYDKQNNLVKFAHYDHHDNVYKWRPSNEH